MSLTQHDGLCDEGFLEEMCRACYDTALADALEDRAEEKRDDR